MKYLSRFIGGPLDGLTIETVIPLGRVVIEPEEMGPIQETDGVQHRDVHSRPIVTYATHVVECDVPDQETRVMTRN